MVKILVVIVLLLIIAFGVWFFLVNRWGSGKISKDNLVIFFGDSLTAGVGANPGEDYPSIISKDLGLTRVINAGVSGDTTETALARLDRDVLSEKPALVIVFLGGNDFLRGVLIETTINNIDSIVRQITLGGAKVVLVHIRSNVLNDKYKAPEGEITKKYNAEFAPDVLDGILTNPDLMADTIHPNSKGYKIVASRIEPAVKKFLQ